MLRHLLVFLFVAGGACVTDSWGQSQSVTDGCGVNIGAIHNSDVKLQVECNSIKEVVSIQYSRLFGAIEVPLLMVIIPDRPAVGLFGGFEERYDGYADRLNSFVMVGKNVTAWRAQYPYRGATPINQKNIWTHVAGRKVAAGSIAWRASAGSREERVCLFINPFSSEASENDQFVRRLLPGRSPEYCDAVFERLSHRVGFTFLILENESDKPLHDVKIFYRETYSKNPVVNEYKRIYGYRAIVSQLGGLADRGDTLENLIKKYRPAAETEMGLARSSRDHINLAKVEPKQKLIALLDIFIAGANDLPAAYPYGIFVFDELSYTLDGSTITQRIRAPHLDKAARQVVPYGWAHQ